MIGLTPGNLIIHLRKLEEAGYVSSEKTTRRLHPVAARSARPVNGPAGPGLPRIAPPTRGYQPLPRGTCTTRDPRPDTRKHHPGDGRTSPPILLFHDLKVRFFRHEGRTFKVMEVSGPEPGPSHELLSEVVLEPEADGIPVRGRASQEITCEICHRAVGADIARTVEVAKPWPRNVKVCSVNCARAAHADPPTCA